MDEDDYNGTLTWEWYHPYHGYRGRFSTPAEDFALPTPEEEGWDLI